MNWEKIVLGELGTNCYLVWNKTTKEAVVIDPADDGVTISEEIQRLGLNLIGILATHGHFDHLLGALDLKLIYQVPFYCHSADQFLLNRQNQTAKHFLGRNIAVPNFQKIDRDLKEIDQIQIGTESLQVIKTPGHTPGSVCFYSQKDNLLFTGDTLTAEGEGDISHQYSYKEELAESLGKIKNLPKETLILSGHGEEFQLLVVF